MAQTEKSLSPYSYETETISKHTDDIMAYRLATCLGAGRG